MNTQNNAEPKYIVRLNGWNNWDVLDISGPTPLVMFGGCDFATKELALKGIELLRDRAAREATR